MCFSGPEETEKGEGHHLIDRASACSVSTYPWMRKTRPIRVCCFLPVFFLFFLSFSLLFLSPFSLFFVFQFIYLKKLGRNSNL